MIKADVINDYLEWRQEKSNNLRYWAEDRVLSPEAWIEEVLMSDARDRINLIKDLLESDSDLDPVELANKIHSLVYDPLEVTNVEARLGDEDSEQSPEEV